jgi:hypothetical protein
MADTGSTHIGPYEIRRRIGRGGMAAVYAAWDPTLQREVAVKVLSPAMTPDAVLRERFVREAKVNLRLDHTAILPIHSLGEADDSVYIVMTLATGGCGSAAWRARRRPRRTTRPDEVLHDGRRFDLHLRARFEQTGHLQDRHGGIVSAEQLAKRAPEPCARRRVLPQVGDEPGEPRDVGGGRAAAA